ncbi:hypothetical protein [Streptomyces sp. NPDC058157]|uniref:hypothetical protein n=1 Tax=Streptomyces sp. NPDC058157 TaxID=3346360 RepID=UPI0036E32E2F
MARLVKTGTETLTFDRFKIELDEGEEIPADLGPFVRRLLQYADISINAVYLDDRINQPDFKTKKEATSVWHCTAPPSQASRTIVITEPT